MKKNQGITIILLIGIIIVLNLVSKSLFFRADLTEGQQYSLSQATKDILKTLDEPVTVTAYFSQNLPPDLNKSRQDLQDLLVEYANISKGYVDFEFLSPETDEEKQAAAQEGIQPVLINVREKDQAKQQQSYMGAVVRVGEQVEPIPLIQPGMALEYALTTSIKKVSVKDKPAVAFVQGHGEPPLSELGQVYLTLSVLYGVETLDLTTEPSIPDRLRAVAIVAPKDSFPPDQLAKLDDYLSRGGKLLIAYNAVDGDLQNSQGNAITTGLETWLTTKGVEISSSFLVDAQCGSVSVQQRQGFFTVNTPVQFPYLPLISNFTEHPITKGLEQVLLPFASPVQATGDTDATFTPIAYSSAQAGRSPVPTYFNVQKQWTTADFPEGNIPVGGVLEGTFGGSLPTKIVVFGDGDFAIGNNPSRGGQTPDNISLLANAVDWLSDDTGLVELRTKGVASRPIDQEIMAEEASGTRNLIKYLNFGLPILLVLIYGFIRSQRQRNLRLKRREESYA